MQDRAVRIRAKNDIAELLGLNQASLRAHRVGELLALGNRLTADLARGVDIVLRLNRGDNFSCRDAEFGQFVRLNPYTQRILSTEDLNARDAFNAS